MGRGGDQAQGTLAVEWDGKNATRARTGCENGRIRDEVYEEHSSAAEEIAEKGRMAGIVPKGIHQGIKPAFLFSHSRHG
jgi:hypothetical protein